MADTASTLSAVPAPAPKALPPGQVLITGRCLGVRKAGKSFAHMVVQPAPDPYSHPNTLEVFAESRLADAEQEFRAVCNVRGRPRSYNQVDEFGEKRTVRTADCSLWAVK